MTGLSREEQDHLLQCIEQNTGNTVQLLLRLEQILGALNQQLSTLNAQAASIEEQMEDDVELPDRIRKEGL